MRLIAVVVGSHVIRWVSEELYHEYCAGFFTSIFAYGSPTCHGFRWVADSITAQTVAILSATALKAVECVYGK
jgi:hypothetical protein